MKVALVINALVVCSIIFTEAELAEKRTPRKTPDFLGSSPLTPVKTKRLGYRAGKRGPGFLSVSTSRIMRRMKNWQHKGPTKNKDGRLTSSATWKGLTKIKRRKHDGKGKVTSDSTKNNVSKQNTPQKVGAEMEQTTSVPDVPAQGMAPAGGYGRDMGMMGHGMGMDPMMGGGMDMGMGGMASGSKMMAGLLGTMMASQVAGTLATTASGIATTVLSANINQNSGSGTSSSNSGSETSGNNMGSSGVDNAASSGGKTADSGAQKGKPVKNSSSDDSSKSTQPTDKGSGNNVGNSKEEKKSTTSTTSSTTQKPNGDKSLGGHSNKDIDAARPSV